MRIARLEVTGFRGFGKRQSFDLDADAVILVASNGLGKTCLFDALLWGLSGRVPRLGDDDTKLISLYSETGGMEVSVSLREESGRNCRVLRSSTGSGQLLTVEVDGTIYKGPEAHSQLMQLVWPPGLVTTDADQALAAAITRSVYLQQDLVRHFIESESEQERFNAVSELVGTGRLTDLQIQLDNARSAWTKATNFKSNELSSLRQRNLGLENQVSRLSGAPSEYDLKDDQWQGWWERINKLGIKVQHVPSRGKAEAAGAIDSAIKRLQATRAANERTKADISTLLDEIKSREAFRVPNLATLRGTYKSTQRDLDKARADLKKAQELAVEERRRQVLERNAQEELRTLATLALRRLGERCPVCDQSYERTRTINRLKSIAETTGGEQPILSQERVATLADLVAQHERALVEAQSALHRAEMLAKEHQTWLSERNDRLRTYGVDPAGPDPSGALQRRLKELTSTSAALSAEQDTGERMALMLTRSAEQLRKAEIERELSFIRDQAGKLEKLVSNRQGTGKLATQVLEGLREAATDIVEAELARMGPVLQRIYARIDPHPAFRAVRFLTRFAYRRGRLCMSIHDSSAQVITESPETVLSSSQLNALAVAVFLTFNLGLQRLPLYTAILDDPVQSLDDINLLGVVDLLRRVKDSRQLIVSTHDSRFGQLLERKLRPVMSDQRTHVIEFVTWTREGPIVVERDVIRDVQPLKIAV